MIPMKKYGFINIIGKIKNFHKNSENFSEKKKDFYKNVSKLALGSVVIPTVILANSPSAFAAENINVGVNEYYRFTAKGNVTRIAVGNPNIADVTLLPNTNGEFLIIGKNTGSTSLLIWRGQAIDEYFITVGANDAGTAALIQQAIGLPNVRVRVVSTLGMETQFKEKDGASEGGISSGNRKRILLEGSVRDQIEHDRAVKIASLYTGDKLQKPERRGKLNGDDDKFEYDTAYRSNGSYENVVDLLTIEAPTLIRIEAQIVEVSATDDDKWGLTFANPTKVTVDGSSGYKTVELGDDNVLVGGETFGGSHNTGFWVIDHFAELNTRLQLLMKKGKAKVLSRPNISTMSGSKAKIHIGGQIPFPKSDGNNNVSFEWKDYGIRLNIDPIVGEDNSVTADVHAEVSTLDYDHEVVTSTTTMPAIRSRNVHSLVHIDPGNTMIIGGLLSSDDAKVVKKVPILSSIPIIGEFFKHHANTNERRELIILLTPRIATQNEPALMSDKMQEWYAQQHYDAEQRKEIDPANPPMPKEVEERLEAEEKERREKEAMEHAESPGTHLYDKWMKETGGSSDGGDYSKFEKVNTP